MRLAFWKVSFLHFLLSPKGAITLHESLLPSYMSQVAFEIVKKVIDFPVFYDSENLNKLPIVGSLAVEHNVQDPFCTVHRGDFMIPTHGQ